jgi:hypothetical protein
MTVSQSGYLSDYGALAASPDAASSSRAVTQAIDPAQVSIAEVVWRAEARPDIGPDERDALIAQLRHELQQRVQALQPRRRAGRHRSAPHHAGRDRLAGPQHRGHPAADRAA